jgi:hypothetical protein
MRYQMKPVRFRILQFICSILTAMLIESILFLASEENPATDTIPGYALLALLISTPINYAIGHLSKWAQHSESE